MALFTESQQTLLAGASTAAQQCADTITLAGNNRVKSCLPMHQEQPGSVRASPDVRGSGRERGGSAGTTEV